MEGTSHPDRDAQFWHINEQVQAFQASGDPVISVDTKKKELVGDFKNDGREWRPEGQPEEVRCSRPNYLWRTRRILAGLICNLKHSFAVAAKLCFHSKGWVVNCLTRRADRLLGFTLAILIPATPLAVLFWRQGPL